MFEELTLAGMLAAVVVAAPAALVALLGVALLLNRPLSERATATSAATIPAIGLVAAVGMLGLMLFGDSRHETLEPGNWVHLHDPTGGGDYHFAFKFVFDRLSVPFVILTFVLCGTIAAFSGRYLHRERGYQRFFFLYSLFLAGMVTAAAADTIETLFVGWELVGLSSALLVGFFHERAAPVRNAFRVWVVYRVADAALLLAAILLHHLAGAGDLDLLTGYRDHAEGTSWPYGIAAVTATQATLVGGLLVIAAAGKSALVPFSGWLPRAMEGPTPSSAVFYGALSVHLGAFLLLRAGPLLDASPWLAITVVVLGLATAAYAALTARVQTDIKSALAFASLTQVGLIVAEIGLGWRYIPLAHLLGHACLRTLQFLRAPSLLHDRHRLENALGGHVPHTGGSSGGWLYRFAMERGHLDAIIDRFVVGPFVAVFTWFDRVERRFAGTESPAPTTAAEPAPQTESVEQHA